LAPRTVRVSIAPLPHWVDRVRLLASHDLLEIELASGKQRVELALPADQAALLMARLRGLGLDGEALQIETTPCLSRALVRAGRLSEARERRVTTPGFSRPSARATGEGRYSLTPETLALRMGELAAGRSVVEACVGSGGNSIGFARAGCHVTGFELDGGRLAEARHNTALYGVASRVQLVHGDALLEVPKRSAEILFIDPPWGGEEYDKRSTDRSSFPVLDRLLAADLSAYREVWIKVPNSFRVASVPGAVASAWFGEAAGDKHRIKFVLLRVTRPST
jgi:16S rRNA G966 N2-methylase RsmD